MEFVLNGVGSGSVGKRLMAHKYNPRALQPYRLDDQHEEDPRSYIAVANGFNPDGSIKLESRLTANDLATLRIREWIELDGAIQKAARPNLQLVGDLRSRGLTYGMSNGMGKTILQYQRMTDPGSATVSMDALRRGRNDRAEFDTVGLPLPIISSDFTFTLRDIETARSSGNPLDTVAAEAAGRRVADTAEQMLLGTYGSFAYGGYNIYGYRNFPSRQTKTMTAPTTGGWVPATTLTEVLDMKQKSMNTFHRGPWVLYTSFAWDQYLDADYSSVYPGVSLRERLKKIRGIDDVVSLDFLTGYEMILVQMSSETIREVIGMDITTIQWEEEGGMEFHFKVMAILVPQPRVDINGNCGIVHGS